MIVTEAWTTNIGRVLNEMQAAEAPERHIRALEDELLHAIQCVRHVRKCYNLPARYHQEHGN